MHEAKIKKMVFESRKKNKMVLGRKRRYNKQKQKLQNEKRIKISVLDIIEHFKWAVKSPIDSKNSIVQLLNETGLKVARPMRSYFNIGIFTMGATSSNCL